MDKPVLVMTVGLPQSGKSTWAKQQGHPIVSPDAIRLALHGQPFVGRAEPFIWAIAKVMVRALFQAGHETVILDATNTTQNRRDDWIEKEWARRFEVFDTDVSVCKERAAQTAIDEAHRADLIAAIDRMHLYSELPTDEERNDAT